MIKVVPDTNVLVSGVIARAGPPARLLDAWREGRYVLVSSPALLAELLDVLTHPRIQDRYPIPPDDIEALLTLLERQSILTPGRAPEASGAVPEDPADERALACALEAGADFIVSGDRHLLRLGTFHEIPIVTPRAFLERLESPSSTT